MHRGSHVASFPRGVSFVLFVKALQISGNMVDSSVSHLISILVFGQTLRSCFQTCLPRAFTGPPSFRVSMDQTHALFVSAFHPAFQLKSEKLKQTARFSAQLLKSLIFICTAKSQKLKVRQDELFQLLNL